MLNSLEELWITHVLTVNFFARVLIYIYIVNQVLNGLDTESKMFFNRACLGYAIIRPREKMKIKIDLRGCK